MKTNDERTKDVEDLYERIENLQHLLGQVMLLEAKISKMGEIFKKFSTKLEASKTETRSSSNIIPFPGIAAMKPKVLPVFAPFLARPGSLLASEILDFRPFLQRDGLILLAWDKRITETGELYSAYWVTSAGIPRFYASKPLPEQDFHSARPDHKSYAAEDGIEFYGQAAPAYIVHVAPELMMNNPKHDKLRETHIDMLKQQGSKVDFDYKYLLKTEKNRSLPHRKPEGYPRHRTGA